MKRTLYLKIEQCIELSKSEVTIGDVAVLECSESTILNRIKTEKLFSLENKKGARKIVSVLFVIEKIHKIYPELQVENLGEADFVVSYYPQKQSKFLEIVKVAFVCLVSFFGSMFAMMTFNEDVSTRDNFEKVYTWAMGQEPSGVTILEITYSIGVSVGIIVFFNHFGKKRFSADPTPIEVEMRLYENDIQTTIAETYARKGEEIGMD